MNYNILSLLVMLSLGLAACSSDTPTRHVQASAEVVTLPREAVAKAERSGSPGGGGAVIVPQKAVFTYAGLQGVQVVAPDSVLSVRWVRIGQSLQNGRVEVQSGLDAGESVLASPRRSLQDGTIITVTE